MSSSPKSPLFLVGMVSMAVVWLAIPLLSRKAERKAERKAVEATAPEKPRFQYAPPPLEVSSGADTAVNYSDEQVRRQLDRHARMSTNGFYQRIVDNPDTPEEIRSRFLKERERLEALAKAHPKISVETRAALVPPAVLPDGSFSPEFKETVSLMKQYGVWDTMVENYVEQMKIDAANPDLPESMRPTPEQIEEARRTGNIPTL